MALLYVIIYFSLISASGCFFLRKSRIDPVLILPSGFMLGSIIAGGIMFLLVTVELISPLPIALLCGGMLVLGIFGSSAAFRSLAAIRDFLRSTAYSGKYRLVLLIIIIIGIAFYLVIAYTPPRDADALRYHLAQMKDTVNHKGFVYRPYYHYNFPQYFHYLFIPLFMVTGGTGIQLPTWFYFILSTFLILYFSYKTKHTKHLLLLALFFIFIPRITRASTIFNNDLPVVFYSLMGLLLIVEFGNKPQLRYLIFSYASLGFALGCKYQAILYMPVFMLATFMEMGKHWKFSAKYLIIIILVFIPLLVASPFFIRNLFYTGDPFWPLMPDLFRVEKDYFYQVTQLSNHYNHGSLSLSAPFRSVYNLVTDRQFLLMVWLLWAGYYFSRFSWGKFYKTGTILFFCFWFILQPKMYPRFAVYILPLLAIMSISFCQWFYEKIPRFGKFIYILPVLSILAGMGFSAIYSLDFLKYQVTGNLKEFHQYTWFYDQYNWINENLKDDGKLLVIAGSGQTYYLDKDYLRADPEFSGLIDWSAIKNKDQFEDTLRGLNIRYIFYQDKNWIGFPGGRNMMQLMDVLKSEENVSILLDDNVRLNTLRVLRKGFDTRVLLLDIGKLY